MDIDSPFSSPVMAEVNSKTSSESNNPQSTPRQSEKNLMVHPLAIIGMSDHHTRIQMGGSPLHPSSPVLGLLFGWQDGLDICIIDSEEIEYSHSSSSTPPSNGEFGFGRGADTEVTSHQQSIRLKIELHQKVFPTHELIGWYRVGNTIIPEDLYINNHPSSIVKELNESPLFVLMNPDAEDGSNELPISIYESLVTMGQGNDAGPSEQPRAVFVGLDFELETGEPERIAVEKVFKAQATDGASGLDLHLDSVTSSVESMRTRIATLLDFLRKTHSKEIPVNYNLLRQVDGLLRQLPVLADDNLTTEFDNEYDDMMTLAFLASVAKTAKVVQGYSDKFKHVQDFSNSKVMRGGMFR